MADRWFVPLKPLAAPRSRLFCFPHAGGGTAVFRPWRLPPGMELVAAQLPGRERRFDEPPVRTMAELIPQVGAAILPWLDRPYQLFGHSLGALVVYGLAGWLRRAGARSPDRLIVAGCSAPHLQRLHPPIAGEPDEVFVRRIRELGGTPAEVFDHPELLELVMTVLRADMSLVESVRATEATPLAIPITALGGTDDPDVPRERLEAWSVHTTAAFRTELIPGDHFFRAQPAGLDRVLQVVGEAQYQERMPSR
jgi:medium-chain acyl-[acyl-carrier-protein] hydrolase